MFDVGLLPSLPGSVLPALPPPQGGDALPRGQGTVLPDRETEISAGGITLTVPPGVVSQPATATVVPILGGEPSVGGVGASVHIDADWEDGSRAVEITMPLDPDLASPLGLDLQPAVVHDPGGGAEREILWDDRLRVDHAAGTVSFTTTSLSSFFSISLPRSWLIISAPTATESRWILDAFQDFIGAGAEQPSCDPDITGDPAVTSDGSAFAALPGLGTAIRHCVAFKPANSGHPNRGRWTLANNTGAVLRYNAGAGVAIVNVGPANDLLTDAFFLPLNGVTDTGVDETVLGGEVVIPPGGSAAVSVDAEEEGYVTFAAVPGLQVPAFLLRQVGTVIGSKADAVKLYELLNDCGYSLALTEWKDLPQIIRDCGLTILEQGGLRLAKLAKRIVFAAEAAIAAADSLSYSVAPLTAELGYEPGESDAPTGIGGSLVADVYPGPSSSGPEPSSFVDLDPHAFFFADDGEHGSELWRTDGTAEGTSLVRDVNQGPASSDRKLYSRPELAQLGDHALFPANDGTGTVGLWASDGTAQGTTLVKELPMTVGEEAVVRDFTRLDEDTVLFSLVEVNDNGAAVHGQLWRTDGSAAGTIFVADFGANGIYGLVSSGGVVYFKSASSFSYGDPDWLWRTDGTPAGTVRVTNDEDELPDPGGVYEITPAGDGVVLSGYSPDGGIALWGSDGTAAGTEVLAALGPSYLCCRYGLFPAGDDAFFVADDGNAGHELWKTDGTPGGTQMVKDIDSGPESGTEYGDFLAEDPAVPGGAVYFVADDGTTGRELWRSDGTDGGTVQVANLSPGGAGTSFAGATVIGDDVVFIANALFNDGVWRTDGRTTEQIFHGYPEGPSLGRNIGSAGGKPLFYAKDDAHGFEPWTVAD